jgi:hypothetical protein
MSDGVLAWRVYIVWDRKPWLLRVLMCSLTFHLGRSRSAAISLCSADVPQAIGITAAILLMTISLRPQQAAYKVVTFDSSVIQSEHSLAILYQIWVWTALAINSVMTVSILTRIRYAQDHLWPDNVNGSNYT